MTLCNHTPGSRILRVFFYLLVPAFMLAAPGCKKDDPEIYNFGQSTEDFMQNYLTYTHSFFYVHEMLASLEDSLAVHPGGTYNWKNAQISAQPAEPLIYPKTFIINFGIPRSSRGFTGSITGSVSTRYRTAGAFVEYSFDGLQIQEGTPTGTCTIENQGMSVGRILLEFIISTGYLTRYAGTDSSVTMWLQGNQDILWSESLQELSIPVGLLSGQASDSLQYIAEVDIDYHLIKDYECAFIRDGIFDYVVKNKNDNEIGAGVVDFGYINPAVCDKYVVVVVDAESNRSEYVYIMEWLPQ